MKDLGYNINYGDSGQHLRQFLTLNKFLKIAILTDDNTAKHCLPLLKSFLPVDVVHINIKPGENHKNINSAIEIYQKLTEQNFNRSSLIINLGGGIITDIGGYCASTFKRGISFVNIPTSLLAQVDASVGGKTGVNFNNLKNQIGVFNNPQSVIIDSAFLETLPKRHFDSGLAEVIKHAIIADSIFFDYLLSSGTKINTESIIERAIDIKSNIITVDFHENGVRKKLNFGHTLGHAIESFYIESDVPLLHGEAVALGMKAEAYLSNEMGLLNDNDLEQILKLINLHFHDLHINKSDVEEIAMLTLHDKKNTGQSVNYSLLTSIGECIINQEGSQEDVIKVLNEIAE